MADITQDSFFEVDEHQRVVFQKGRDVPDYDLNEALQVARVLLYRMAQSVGGDGVASGLRVVSTGGANAIRVAIGQLVAAGYRKAVTAATDVTGLTTPVADRTDLVYAHFRETEVDDPHPLAELGVLSRRKKLVVTFHVAQSPTAIPATTGMPWEGGNYYVQIASIARYTGQATILDADITQTFKLLPGPTLDAIVVYANGYADRLIAGRSSIVQTSATNPGALTLDVAPNTPYTGHFLRVRFGRDHAQENVFQVQRDGAIIFTAPSGMKVPMTIRDSVGGVDIPWSDDSAGSEADAGRKLYDGLGRLASVGAGGRSILRAVNGRAMASIGNGTTTFGDFNGTAALVNVIAAALAIPATSLHIYVKQGTYLIPSTITATGLDLVIEGTDETECVFQNTHATQTGIVTTSRLELRRVSFTRSSTATKAITAGNLFMEEVTVTGMSVNLLGGTGRRVWERCTLTASARAVDLGAGSAAGSLVIRDSALTTTANSVPLIYSVTTGGGIGEVCLERCTCIVALGSDSSTESGLVDIESDFGQGTSGVHTTLRFRFIDCSMSGASTPSCIQVGVHIVPFMEFSGCRITHAVRNLAATHLPVFHPRAVNLLVRDCVFDLSGVCSGFGGGTVGGALDFLAVETMTIQNLKILKGSTQMFDDTIVSNGGLAVLYLIAGQHIDLNGVSVQIGSGAYALATIPRQIIHVESASGTDTKSVSLRNIRHETTSAESGAQAVSQAYIRVVGRFDKCVIDSADLRFATTGRLPLGTSAILIGGTGTDTLKTGDDVTVTNCTIGNAGGFGIQDASTGRGLNRIVGCKLFGCGTKTGGTAYSIAATETTSVGMVQITDNVVTSSQAAGIYTERQESLIRGNRTATVGGDGTIGSDVGVYVACVNDSKTNVFCYENTCYDSAGGVGTGFGVIWAGSPISATGRFYGFDTTKDGSGTDIDTLGTMAANQPMRFNKAILK